MTIVFEDREFVKPNGHTRNGLFLDPTLKINIDNFLIKAVDMGHDGIGLITGLEGTGKSTFVRLLAAYCDRTKNLKIENVVFTGKDLMKAIDTAKPGTSLVFDEAIMDMSSQDFATEMQKILIKKFTLIRKKRLFIFIVIPSIFMLRRYFSIFRTRYMINCYCPDGITRGFFRFYSFSAKKKLYLRGYKEMDMGVVKPDFKGRFVDSYGFFVDAEAYEAKKDSAIASLTEDKKDKEFQLKQQFDDYKLKIKIEVQQFKSKLTDKYNEMKAKYMMQLKLEREKAKQQIKEIKAIEIDAKRDRLTKKWQELDKKYSMLLSYSYERMKLDWSYNNPKAEPLTKRTFRNTLMSQHISVDTLPKMKEHIDNGAQLIELETKLVI